MKLFEHFDELIRPSGEVLSEQDVKAAGKPKSKSLMDPWMQHCVVGVMGKGRSKESAFAICTSQGQKAGYYDAGTRTLTDKGQSAVTKAKRDPEHDEVVDEYERLAGGEKWQKKQAKKAKKMVSEAKDRDVKAKIMDYYKSKGKSDEEAEAIANATLAKMKRKRQESVATSGEDVIAESREGFLQWVDMHSQQSHELSGNKRAFTLDPSQGGAFLREAVRRGGALQHFPGRNFVRVRFGDGDMMMRRNKKGYAVVVPPLAGAGY
jgi:hypothetical protein